MPAPVKNTRRPARAAAVFTTRASALLYGSRSEDMSVPHTTGARRGGSVSFRSPSFPSGAPARFTYGKAASGRPLDCETGATHEQTAENVEGDGIQVGSGSRRDHHQLG